MKNLLFSFFAIAVLILSLNSCNEDIELSGEFKETAVVYGLLDQSDSIHMIKITRAFIGPGNLVEIAGVADSSYFESVDATITEIGGLNRVWTLKDTIVTNKDEAGIWYAPEQKLYYFSTVGDSPLNPNAEYKLDIDLNNGEFQVSGKTEIVNGLSTAAANTTYSFKFAQNVADYKNTTVTVSTGNSAVINTILEIGYEEITGTDTTLRTFDWNLGEQDVANNASTITFGAQGEVFYDQIAKHIQSNNVPICDKRNFSHIRIKIVGGASDLYNYMVVNKPSTAIAQSKPTYTNLEATNGYSVVGIFSSTQSLSVYKPFASSASQFIRCIDKNSTIELCTGQYTGPYLFCSDHSVDISFGYSWACN